MAKARTKNAANTVSVPKNLDEAAAFVAAIGAERREVARIEAELNDQLTTLREQADGRAGTHKRRIEELFKGLQIWAEANRHVLCADGSKTKWLPTGMLAWRMTPPKVTLRDVAKVLATLQRMGLDEYVRIKAEVDKEAILSKPGVAERVPGITISQREEFIVEPAEDTIETPKTKATQEVAG